MLSFAVYGQVGNIPCRRQKRHQEQHFYFFISPLFNQVGKLRTSAHLQLQPGQDKAKQFDTYNDTELHMEYVSHCFALSWPGLSCK